MPEKNPKVKLSLKNLAILPSNFDYFLVHLRQKVRLRPELSPTFLLTLGPNPARKARPDLQLCMVLRCSDDRWQKVLGIQFKIYSVVYFRT